MISVEHLIETINHYMDIDGDILSMDVEKNKDGNPVKITILSTFYTSPTEKNILEVNYPPPKGGGLQVSTNKT